MKLLVIPDIHGKTDWKDALTYFKWDKVIFLGDYVDAYLDQFTNVEILHNLKEIIQFKKENNNICELLLGNHDIQYAWGNEYQCKGFRSSMYEDLYHIFYINKELFKICHQENNYLFTHAGITIGWIYRLIKLIKEKLKELETQKIPPWNTNSRVEYQIELLNNAHQKIKENKIEEAINIVMQFWKKWIAMVGFKRGGFNTYGGPLWADKSETFKSSYGEWIQIVGHTPVKQITQHQMRWGGKIIYTDTLSSDLKTLDDKFIVLDIN